LAWVFRWNYCSSILPAWVMGLRALEVSGDREALSAFVGRGRIRLLSGRVEVVVLVGIVFK